ncbi:MAG: hypothetical protein ACOZNI_31475 [Myxococcota bacterium]
MARRGHPRTYHRAEQAFLDVLPASVREEVMAGPASSADLIIGGRPVEVRWVGEGNLGDVRRALAGGRRPDVVVGRLLSPGARDALAQAGVSWVDETGAAEVALGTIIVSRTGRPPTAPSRPARWAPATLAVAESLLCGTEATVSRAQAVTGLSTGSCTTALRTLAELGLLEADAARGRGAGRRVRDSNALLLAYAEAAEALRLSESLRVGVTWRDPVAGLSEVGRTWTSRGVDWCATGAAAAAVLAPHLTTLGVAEVYVDADTMAGLEAVAAEARLKPIEGGRLTLRPMPTQGVRRLASEVGGLRVAPWPRVYVDLRTIGVRGEEAAEHLLEVMHGRRS